MSNRKQKAYEKPIAQNFLDLRGGGYRIVADFDRKRPDFLLTNGNTKAGLELMRYREQGWHNQAHDHTDRMTRFIGDEWINDESINRVRLLLWYKENRETGFALVREPDWPSLVAELKTLIETAGELPQNEPVHFPFANLSPQAQEIVVNGRRRDRGRHAGDFPVISDHFSEVILIRGDLVVGRPRTSVSCRPTAADVEFLQQSMEKHLQKLPEYRANLDPGTPVWLLVHSDGWPPTAHVSNDRIMNDLLEAAKSIATDAEHQFEAVWWLDNATISEEPKLYAID